jgi:hypothetical protein
VLYSGATIDHPVNGAYSFVPARPYEPDGDWGFARPAIEIPGVKAHRGARAASTIYLAPEDARAAWSAVVDQVLDADLVLAVHLDLPAREPRSPETAGAAGASRGKC